MKVVGELKSIALEMRKSRDSLLSSIQFAISEIEKVGKNAGNRETTDDEAYRVIRKIISNLDENIKHEKNESRLELFKKEKSILSSVLPKNVSNEDIRLYLMSIKEEKEFQENKGYVMKKLKEKFGSAIDMKIANSLVQDLFSF